jgi:hypothetical protein
MPSFNTIDMDPVPILGLFDEAILPHIEAMERNIKHLLKLADLYCQVSGRSHARVSTIILNSSRFFGRLRNGGDCTTRNYKKVHDWLVEHLRTDCGIFAASEGEDNRERTNGQ